MCRSRGLSLKAKDCDCDGYDNWNNARLAVMIVIATALVGIIIREAN